MTGPEKKLVAAMLRCAAESDLHAVGNDLSKLGRLTSAAWVELGRARGSAAAAAAALEAEEHLEVAELRAQLEAVEAERDRLFLLINTPRIDDFLEAVRIEAAHQVERWGVEHDAGKRAEDWLTLYTYLLGKAARAHFDGNRDKLLHHIVTVAAVALNWHANATGADTRMRPGVGPEAVPA